MKLYNILTEIENNINLGDKNPIFKEKLDTMSNITQTILISFVEKLNDKDKDEFKSLLNRYPSPSQLKAPSSDLEKRIENLGYKKGSNIGPGEILFHLELKDSSMIGDTNHDLTVGGEVYEVKLVEPSGGPFRPGTKGKITKFDFSQNLFKMVDVLNTVAKRLPNIEDDIEEISPKLLKALESWNQNITKKFTPAQAIYQGELSNKTRKYIVDLITIVKDEIEANTNDEFTTVKFGGVGISPKNKGIEPLQIDKVDDDSVTLNFIGRDVLKILEILNNLDYVGEGDFDGDITKAVEELVADFPSMIIYSNNGKIAVISKDRIKDELTVHSISQNDLRLKVKKEFFQK